LVAGGWGAMSTLIWRLKLVAELEPGLVSETEVARIEREDFAVPETEPDRPWEARDQAPPHH